MITNTETKNNSYIKILQQSINNKETFLNINKFRKNALAFFKKVNDQKVFFNLRNKMIELAPNVDDVGLTFLLFHFNQNDLKPLLTEEEFDQYLIEKINTFINEEYGNYLQETYSNGYSAISNDICIEQIGTNIIWMIRCSMNDSNSIGLIPKLFLNCNGKYNVAYSEAFDTHLSKFNLEHIDKYQLNIYKNIFSKDLKSKILLRLFDALTVHINENKVKDVTDLYKKIENIMKDFEINYKDLKQYNNTNTIIYLHNLYVLRDNNSIRQLGFEL